MSTITQIGFDRVFGNKAQTSRTSNLPKPQSKLVHNELLARENDYMQNDYLASLNVSCDPSNELSSVF